MQSERFACITLLPNNVPFSIKAVNVNEVLFRKFVPRWTGFASYAISLENEVPRSEYKQVSKLLLATVTKFATLIICVPVCDACETVSFITT